MKTSKVDFEFFKSQCDFWIKKFNLDGWGILYIHEKLKNEYGYISFDVESHKASIYLTTEVDGPFPRKRMAETAKHEIIHLLLARLSDYGFNRFITKTALLESEEEIVQKLLRLL